MRLGLTLALGLFASPAMAYDICAELWFVRNLAFDRAGYCFGSNLGQGMFDNADCSTKSPTLSREAQSVVNAIRETEDMLGCKINTTQTWMEVPGKAWHLSLWDLVGPSDWASGCLGWTGPSFPLRAGHDTSAPVIFTAQRGQDIVWEYESFGPPGWEFISVHRGGELMGMGWSNTTLNMAYCTSQAG